ncbi:MAG: hypothetical protein CMO81_07270 [Waddliaceae bacterium]|nr:hypothetical protein [Waddliaceae bacterium]
MESFWRELFEGEVHLRDKFQVELKTDYSPHRDSRKNTYTQEFYFFIPNALQVGKHTYPKEQFYQDQTNFIRFKTPDFSFREILDFNNERSPLNRLKVLIRQQLDEQGRANLEDEIKLLANVVRSRLRVNMRILIADLKDSSTSAEEFHDLLLKITKQYSDIFRSFREISKKFRHHEHSNYLKDYFLYTEEFLSSTYEYYLTGLLSILRRDSDHKKSDEHLCSLIIKEQQFHERFETKSKKTPEDEKEEHVLYRKGLLNKFILDALLLSITRVSVIDHYSSLSGAVAAGIAMLFYFTLFIWQGQIFVINSVPFIVITVILYILKDRMKEGLRNQYKKQAFRWFPDYKTEIWTPSHRRCIGYLTESFAYLKTKELSNEIIQIRNQEFHAELERFKRPETVLYYKKEAKLLEEPKRKGSRRYELNNIFRFNIEHFLSKASNSYHLHQQLNQESMKLEYQRLPKVYHINLIMKNTYLSENGEKKVEWNKFRLVVNKDGIKRIERPLKPRDPHSIAPEQ